MNTALIEVMAQHYANRANSSLKRSERWTSIDEKQRAAYRMLARAKIIGDYGGEAGLYAFCEAVLATKG